MMTPHDPASLRSASLLRAAPVSAAELDGMSDEEQFAHLEAAMRRAQDTHDASSLAVRARYVIEIGTALRLVRDRALYLLAGYTSFGEYAAAQEAGARSRAYQLIDSAQAMTEVIASKIMDTAPRESHAVLLAPILRHFGVEQAREVVQAATASGRLTAASIKRAQRQLNYIPTEVPEPAETAAERTIRPDVRHGHEHPAISDMKDAAAHLQDAHRLLTGRGLAQAATDDARAYSELRECLLDTVNHLEQTLKGAPNAATPHS